MITETNKRERLSLNTALDILKIATLLGLTSFGGPIAHLGYFHSTYVEKKKWLDEEAYADLVALCQFLPGPASSQVGIGIGTIRGGFIGGILAWIGFTLPSAIALALFALLLKGFDLSSAGWIHGLKIVAVAIVGHAVFTMGSKLASGPKKATIAALSAGLILLWPIAYLQVILIGAAGLLGLWLFPGTKRSETSVFKVVVKKQVAIGCLILFFALLVLMPMAAQKSTNPYVDLVDSFYRSGSLVFGGGHVVLPLIESEVVPRGWVSEADFLAGYGAAQAVPGPLFTFSAYLGAMAMGPTGALLALLAIYLPSFLLVMGVLPFWGQLRSHPKVTGPLVSINAAVVGILLAALYNPLWTNAILSSKDFVLLIGLFLMLHFWKLPPWIVVCTGAFGGMLLKLI